MQSFICLTSGQGQGAEWACELGEGLPGVEVMRAGLPDAAFQGQAVSLLLDDDLLHPLRVQLEEKPARNELEHFLLWKLKKILPYPVDQVALRHTPLPEADAWLTMTLPKRWTQDVFQLFAERGVHLGHIGGVFTTLLETQTQFRKRTTLALFGDFYLLAALDARGGFQQFRTRRLPFTEAGDLDLDTLIENDLAPAMADAGEGQTPVLLCLNPRHDGVAGRVAAGLEARVGGVLAPQLSGNTHARITTLQHSGVA